MWYILVDIVHFLADKWISIIIISYSNLNHTHSHSTLWLYTLKQCLSACLFCVIFTSMLTIQVPWINYISSLYNENIRRNIQSIRWYFGGHCNKQNYIALLSVEHNKNENKRRLYKTIIKIKMRNISSFCSHFEIWWRNFFVPFLSVLKFLNGAKIYDHRND